jgi:antitoxin (DNA-binding transcriptional repressor) of toxin-antitoxin stability system
VGDMPNIAPISELENYSQVLEQVKEGSPVYLTKDGKGKYSIHSIEDDEKFENARAVVRLMSELNAGLSSGEEDGWISETDVRQHFQKKRLSMEENK